MGNRRAEYRHHRIADMLVDRTAEFGHRPVDHGKEPIQEGMSPLRPQPI